VEIVAATLFGKARQAVLTTLFEQSDRSFFMRELSRLTGIGSGPLQHELAQLVKADLVLREPDGNRINFRANTANPVFPELLGLIEKTCGMPIVIAKALDSLGAQISHAAIYGSIAKGSNHGRSDVDLLVVGEIEFGALVAATASAESRLGRDISLRLFNETELRRRIDEGERFLCGVITGPLQIIKGDWDGIRNVARARLAAGSNGCR
jgi:predicted nucleotidyltransferase